jgi:seryl-tRNA synthetase
MLDIRLIREKPDFVRERLSTRGGGDEAKIDDLLEIDARERLEITQLTNGWAVLRSIGRPGFIA